MNAKIVNNFTKPLVAKAMFDVLKNVDHGDVFYAGVAFPRRLDYTAYAGAGQDSENSEFQGGASADFDEDLKDLYFYHQHMVSIHKVYSGGVSRVAPRQDWERGNVYNSWPAADSHVIVKQFVAGVASLNVYRCLFSPGTASEVAPSTTSATHTNLSDGYVWKFAYTISNSDALRFLSQNWMPVPEPVTQTEAESLSPGSNRFKLFIIQNSVVRGTVFDIDSLDGNGTYTVTDLSGTPEQECVIQVTGGVKRLIRHGIGYTGPCLVKKDGVDKPSIHAYVSLGQGHGSAIGDEMGASHVAVTSRCVPDGEINNFLRNTKYNMVMLLKNPIDALTGRRCTKDFYVTCKGYRATSRQGGVNVTDVATFDGNTYYVVKEAGKDKLYNIASDSVSGVTAIPRQVVFGSGQVLAVDWKVAEVLRSDEQIETLTFIVGF
jgi:hypothetical protein